MAGKVFVATESGSAEVKGELFTFIKHVTRVREGHPLLKDHSGFFEPVEDNVTYEVEQATKAPGEKKAARTTRRTARK